MIKRILLIVAVLMPLLAKAQLAVGEWKVYTTFANEITKMLDTPDKVYYLSEGCLFSYDKETDESYSYSSANKLNDNNISSIYYNKNNKYLFVAYTSGNIDLLYDNGEIINMSDIKDASLTSSKNINDVAFYDNRIYVATAFGLVIYDDQKHQVIESGIYEKDIKSVEVVADHIVISHNWYLYSIDIENKINKFDNYKKLINTQACDMQAIYDNKLMYIYHNNYDTYQLRVVDVDFSKDVPLYNTTAILMDGCKYIYENKENIILFNKTTLAIFDESGNMTSVTLPSELQGKSIAMWNGLNSIWAGDKQGLGNYDISSETLIVLKDNFKPESSTVKSVDFLIPGKSGKIYVLNTAASKIANVHDAFTQSQINSINKNKIENIVPTEFTKANKNNPSGNNFYDNYRLVEDPLDAESYYLGSYWDGVYKIKNGKQINKYDWTNSTIKMLGTWSCNIPDLAFDKNNNLWVLNFVKAGFDALHFISAENLAKETTEITDWVSINLGDFIGDKDGKIMICNKSNMIFLTDGSYNSKLVAYDTKGTYDNPSDDEYLVWESFIDQDGKTFSPIYISSLCEDENGRIWIGTKYGVIEITNASNAMNTSMTINRIKVPRNDGTQLADYLLDNLQVTSISVDNSNRKWISTSTSGVYLVSESGDEIIEHFTTENSQLPSNRVYSVLSDPNSNSVFIGTDLGLAEYSSTSSPSQDDYSNVYAYPNPVRPEYTGWITIKGLMENSLVKIADAAGNVFYTTQSEGGMVTWDGCNTDGQRVKTGVYYVFASQGQEGEEKTGAVTKILVVN